MYKIELCARRRASVSETTRLMATAKNLLNNYLV